MRVNIDEAIACLVKGDVVAIPTETVYGLAADASNEDALKAIYRIKERPADNPLIVHIASAALVIDWATHFPTIAKQMAEAFWPGPLTLVLPARAHISSILTAGQPTVALRVPNHPSTLALLKKSGLGLAAPSANKYTQLSPTQPAHVEKGLGLQIPVLDGGACTVGIESTIVQVYQAQEGEWCWQLLRAGMVSEQTIEKVVDLPQMLMSSSLPSTKVPGQHALHYAPHTPLLICENREVLIARVAAIQAQHKTCVALLLGDGALPVCQYRQLGKQPSEYAAAFYAALHQLDTFQTDTILIEMPPKEKQWLPILDRLARAVLE